MILKGRLHGGIGLRITDQNNGTLSQPTEEFPYPVPCVDIDNDKVLIVDQSVIADALVLQLLGGRGVLDLLTAIQIGPHVLVLKVAEVKLTQTGVEIRPTSVENKEVEVFDFGFMDKPSLEALISYWADLLEENGYKMEAVQFRRGKSDYARMLGKVKVIEAFA